MFFFIISYLLLIVFWLWIIRKYDKFEREPLKTIVYVLVAGGVISVIPAGLFNLLGRHLFNYLPDADDFGNVFSVNALLFYGFAGLNEEVCKAVATVLLIRRHKAFNEPADALVYAMTVALGFAMIENIGYFVEHGFASLYIRQFNAVPLHLGLAAIWGMGIAKAKFLNRGKYFNILLPYLALAGFLHFAYNISIMLLANSLLSLLLPTLFAFYLIRYAVKKIQQYSEDGPFSTITVCRNCNEPNQKGAQFCKKCNQPVNLEFYDICKACNKRVLSDACFCEHCGASTPHNESENLDQT